MRTCYSVLTLLLLLKVARYHHRSLIDTPSCSPVLRLPTLAPKPFESTSASSSRAVCGRVSGSCWREQKMLPAGMLLLLLLRWRLACLLLPA
jgi:hypothetical protein